VRFPAQHNDIPKHHDVGIKKKETTAQTPSKRIDWGTSETQNCRSRLMPTIGRLTNMIS
jgi:hypothetical protein